MKLNNQFLSIFKFCFIALLIRSLEAKNKRSSYMLQRFQENSALFELKFLELSIDNVKDIVFGMIAGFVRQKVANLSNLQYKIATDKLTKEILSQIFCSCIPSATRDFQADTEAATKSKYLEVFVSVFPKGIADERLKDYIDACKNNDMGKINEYTEDHKTKLSEIIEKGGYILLKDSSENQSQEKKILLKDLKEIKQFLDYEDKNFITYYLAETRNICDYIYKKDTLLLLVKRWLDYGINIVTCGAKAFIKEIFNGNDIFLPLMEKAFIQGVKKLLLGDVYKLLKSLYQMIHQIYTAEKSFFQIGEDFGRKVGVEIVFVPGVPLRRKYRKKKMLY